MGNKEEKMKSMPRAVLDVNGSSEVVLQFNMGKIKVIEEVVSLQKLEWNPATSEYTSIINFGGTEILITNKSYK